MDRAQKDLLAVRIPLRVSFGGGGTDIDTYYNEHGGVVLSTTVTRYGLVTCERIDSGFEVSALNYMASCSAEHAEDIAPEPPFILARAALQRLWHSPSGARVSIGAEVATGSGLGTSCALVVALCRALLAAQGETPTPGELAEIAYSVDTEGAGQSSGKQDHYAAAFGGLNVIRFTADGVSVVPAAASPQTVAELEARTMLFFGGTTRQSASILAGQRAASARPGEVRNALHSVKELAEEMIVALEHGDLDAFGEFLARSWEHKKRFSPAVSTPQVDTAYDAAMGAGALGGKLTGAGAGGHLLLQVPLDRQPSVRDALSALGWDQIPIALDPSGPAILRAEG